MDILSYLRFISHIYNWYLHVITYIEHRYNALKAWALDGHVFYKALIGGSSRQHILIYNYDTFFYVLILSILKGMKLNNMVLMETPDNIVLHVNCVNIYAYYQDGKIQGVITRGGENEETHDLNPVLYVMIDDVINVTHEFEYFKRYINAMELTAMELMYVLRIFKYRREFQCIPPLMSSITVLYDRTYKEQVFTADDVVSLSHD